ncbi:hypothetical protein KASHIRA_02270 [Serratia phage vB_SmaM-Kashira]|nr:hypothetical protein KASHIRA_02270 [Serratia phage vB_SmaM-Kashira]
MKSTIETIYRCSIDFEPGENLEVDQVLDAAEKFHDTIRKKFPPVNGFLPPCLVDIETYNTPVCCYIQIQGYDRQTVENIAAKTERYILRFKGSRIL